MTKLAVFATGYELGGIIFDILSYLSQGSY
jgi:hypothetical protein